MNIYKLYIKYILLCNICNICEAAHTGPGRVHVLTNHWKNLLISGVSGRIYVPINHRKNFLMCGGVRKSTQKAITSGVGQNQPQTKGCSGPT